MGHNWPELVRALRRLDEPHLLQLVADLFVARGYEVEQAHRRIHISRGSERYTITIRSRGQRIVDSDSVIEPCPDRRFRDIRVLSAGDIADLLLYSIDRQEADALCHRYLDVPLEEFLSETSGTTREGWDRVVLTVTIIALAVIIASFAMTGGHPSETRGSSNTQSVTAPPEEIEIGAQNSRSGGTGRYPPGLNNSGVVDANQLATFHVRKLSGRSYTMIIIYRVYVDGALSTFRRTEIRVESPRKYTNKISSKGDLQSLPGPLPSESIYRNGSVRIEFSPSGDPECDRISRIGRRATQRTPFSDVSLTYISWYLASNESSVGEPFVENGTTRYQVIAYDAPTLKEATNITRAVVDKRGIVHQLERHHEIPGSNRSVELIVRYTDIGATTVGPVTCATNENLSVLSHNSDYPSPSAGTPANQSTGGEYPRVAPANG